MECMSLKEKILLVLLLVAWLSSIRFVVVASSGRVDVGVLQLFWNITWGGSGSELTRSVGVNKDSMSIYVAGSTTSYGNGDFDVVLLRFGQDGNLTLSKTWGGQLLDRSHCIAVDDPFIYIVGDTKSYAVGDEDAFLLKVDVEGGNTIPEFDRETLPFLFAVIVAACAGFVVMLKKSNRR